MPTVSYRPVGLRAAPVVLAVALGVLGLVETGSVAITRVTLPGHAREAGRAAAEAVGGRPTMPETAVLAYGAAQRVADGHRETVRRADFTVYGDGRVKLTGEKTAPTVLLHLIPGLRDLTHAHATVTVEPPPR